MKNFLRRVKRAVLTGLSRSTRTSFKSHRTSRNHLDRQGLHASLSSPKLKHIRISMSSPLPPGVAAVPATGSRFRIGPNACKSGNLGPPPKPARPFGKTERPRVNPGAWRRRNETIARFFEHVQILSANRKKPGKSRCGMESSPRDSCPGPAAPRHRQPASIDKIFILGGGTDR